MSECRKERGGSSEEEAARGQEQGGRSDEEEGATRRAHPPIFKKGLVSVCRRKKMERIKNEKVACGRIVDHLGLVSKLE